MILDWSQLGWALAGFFLIMFFALWAATRGQAQSGRDQGWHERQHWETDTVVKGKLERQ
jgi:hypothetical protein